MREYLDDDFRNAAFEKTPWLDSILEEYSSKKERILVKCKCGHIVNVSCKDLCRDNRLKVCPECRKQAYKRYCKNCGKLLNNRHQTKFCSSRCAAIYNNSLRTKKYFCLNCGKEITSKYAKKFCSIKCSSEYQSKLKVERWKRNPKLFSSSHTIHFIRTYLMKKYNNSCQKCGWHEKNKHTGIVPLEVHHINGDPTDNREENLQLLCPNCHALTDTYRFLNKNTTRKRYN